MVFAEHRYYGVSKPFKKTLKEHMQFLTSEQAMADYAELITELKHDLGATTSAVIGFGGSYGEPPAIYYPRCNAQPCNIDSCLHLSRPAYCPGVPCRQSSISESEGLLVMKLWVKVDSTCLLPGCWPK